MKVLICKLRGHTWRNKVGSHGKTGIRVCIRCKREEVLMYKKYGNIRYQWEPSTGERLKSLKKRQLKLTKKTFGI